MLFSDKYEQLGLSTDIRDYHVKHEQIMKTVFLSDVFQYYWLFRKSLFMYQAINDIYYWSKNQCTGISQMNWVTIKKTFFCRQTDRQPDRQIYE